jgi:hypothetical protein
MLVLLLLLVAALPSFGRCISCLGDGNCGPGDTNKCVPTIDGCRSSGPCQIAIAPLASEYRIASVEITHGTDTRIAEAKSAKRIAQIPR